VFLFLYFKDSLHKKFSYVIILLLDQNTTAFKEVAIIRHPRIGEYAFGFITSTVVLQVLDLLYIEKLLKQNSYSMYRKVAEAKDILLVTI
jgi:uncharacterized membrane protein